MSLFSKKIPISSQIFVNRNLYMDMIEAVGFDMDYTLIRYKKETLEKLIHDLALQRLVKRGYPQEIKSIIYDKKSFIRGLTVDKKYGNILKLDRYNQVLRAFNEGEILSEEKKHAFYRKEKLNFQEDRFDQIDTLFSLPEISLYTSLMKFMKKHVDKDIDIWKIFEDTKECVDEIHYDQSLKTTLKSDFKEFIDEDPLLPQTLYKLKSSKKKMFLLTNSYWSYTNAVMSYLLDNKLKECPCWQDYFDVVLVGANKPWFFQGKSPILEIDVQGQIIGEAQELKKKKIYQGGNINRFEELFFLSGDEILYVGDHIYGDILSSKKTAYWRTALIVEELKDEVEKSIEHYENLNSLCHLKMEYYDLQNRENIQNKYLSKTQRKDIIDNSLLIEYDRIEMQREKTRLALKSISEQQKELAVKLDGIFNKKWGMIFKEGNQNTRFSEQVSKYACIYTSAVSNFLYYSAYEHFYSSYELMPHEQSFENITKDI